MAELLTPQPARHPNPTTKARRLTHLVFERPDLERAERFLTDFGLRVAARSGDALFLRGTAAGPPCYRVERGVEPRFVGIGLAVASRAELEALAALPGASELEAVPAPFGGERVRLTDPSGFVVEAVCAPDAMPELGSRAPLPFNSPGNVGRVNATQRPEAEPPAVVKLGHVVLEVADYQATSAWYTRHFGLIPSDVQVLPDGSPAVTFFRLDLGDAPADHHTLALVQSFMPSFGHAAFELVDADAVGMGQRVLREGRYRHAWGIGRHILGSQIFDYWCDPWGAKHEHYCDGDLFTAEQPTGVHPVSREAMAQWGQPMPSSFTKPQLTAASFGALLRNLRRSPDVSVRKLVTLARIFG